MRHALLILLAAPLLSHAAPASSPSTAPTSSPSTAPTSTPPEAAQPGLLPALAAVAPGLLLHGSGLYLAGDPQGARALLIAEGAGLGALLGGIGLLAVTGASREASGPLIGLTLMGAGLFTTSALADLYGAAGGAALSGRPRPWPMLSLTLGHRAVSDPIFSYEHLAHLDARLAQGAWGLRLGALIGLDESTHRLEGDLSYRLGGRRISWLDLRLGARRHRVEDLSALTGEAALRGRLGLGALSPTLSGAFALGELGWGLELRGYEGLPNRGGLGEEASALLLGRFGFGFGIGAAVEIEAAYDNRRDGYAGGLNLSEIGAGNTGNLCLAARYIGAAGWGLAGEITLGAATLGGLDLIYTWGRR
ncbi:hypothetical protein KKF91_12570 [Myxococcota bacterium]|nr:hypothetical protein [Myxococcota bacterium]MBU1431367.1 hypothetical protein [Myxococcota bacterium]